MKILFVAELRDHARAKQRLLALQDLGHEVLGISSIAEGSSDRPSIWQRIQWKLGYPSDTINLNQKLPEVAQEFMPDLIWIEKVLTLFPASYLKLRKILPKAKMVFYSEDDIFMRHNRSVYLHRSLPLFDLVFTTKPRNLEELPQLGAKRVFCIYQAYDRDLHQPIILSSEDRREWSADVSFVGTFECDRAEQMMDLAKQGIKIKVWGNDWQKWKSNHPNLQIQYRPALNQDFIKVICGSKINLNFLRQANRDRHTSRSLEIPACGGFMLTERTEEHQDLFVEGKEAEYFDSTSELLEKIHYYLVHDGEREAIAKAGQERCIRSRYSHHDRLQVMLAEIF
jgi:spore maturation protein CgeB